MNFKVVYLVDNKRRDLPGAALLARQLSLKGISCELQPLEAYRAVIYAFKPHLVIFNHLLASHLVAFSHRLRSLGIGVAVLPNEGIYYNRETLMFNAGRAHNNAHVDLFFCWNSVHRAALESVGFESEILFTTGSPRFDFYFEPWKGLYRKPSLPRKTRPRILFCTNLSLAKFYELPKAEADRFFSSWAKNVSSYKDYWGAVGVVYRNRQRVLTYLENLLGSGAYDITLRVHPSEDIDFYKSWLQNLSMSKSQHLQLDQSSHITDLMLSCDIEVSLDSCTTAVDAWLAGKPTIELALEPHELLSHPILDGLNVRCESPSDIITAVAEALSASQPIHISYARKKHIDLWFGDPKGNSAAMIAETIANFLKGRSLFRSGVYTFSDFRRGIKLMALNKLGKPYNWHPQLLIRLFLNTNGSYIKRETLQKTITPTMVKEMNKVIKSLGGSHQSLHDLSL